MCTAYRDATKNVTAPRTYDGIVQYVKETLPVYQAALRKLAELNPPSRDAAAVRAWLAADRSVARALRELADAAERRDYPSINVTFGRIELASSRGRRAAAGLGLQVCAKLSVR